MTDLVFAFDAAVDRPLAIPEGAPPAVAETIAGAAGEALAAAVTVARESGAGALVLCGRVLDPQRASPAQAAALRQAIVGLAAVGCRTVVVADDTASCHALARMVGEPAGLAFVTPLAPVRFDLRGLAVEILSAHGPADPPLPVPLAGAAPLERRIVVGCDAADAADDHAMAAAAWSLPGVLRVWGSRRSRPLPGGVRHLPPLQAHSPREPWPGACGTLALFDRAADDATRLAPDVDWRAGWTEVPTHRVAWRALGVESVAGGDEELATVVWGALEGLAPGPHGPLQIVDCLVACGTSVARRVRVGEIAAETLARVRDLFDARGFRVWLRDLAADPAESLAPLGHSRSGGRPGSTTSFSSALADIVTALEESAPPADAAAVREAGWLALELVESL